jgi:ribonuclease HI
MTSAELWTDGACSGNPGPGGWGAVLLIGDAERELSGGESKTTNNRMEMTAVIEGLRALEDPGAVAIHIDSTYVMDAFTKGWLGGWQRRGWVKGDKKPVLNRDLWELMLVEVGRHQVTWVKVKGHSGNELNDRVDELAVAACRTYGGRQPE